MISLVGEKLIRGPRFDDRQMFLEEFGHFRFGQCINLEEGWSRLMGHYDEGAECQARGVTFMRFRMSNLFAPDKWQCHSVLENIVLTEAQTYLHCFAGVDRTGFIVGLYRVLVMGFTPEQAWEEAAAMGMHARYQFAWKHSFFERCQELRGTRAWVQK